MSDCLAENDVVDLLDGRLAPSEVERITAHLDACDACRELVADAAREMPSSSPSGASTATRGTCVGRYVVIDRIGVGAMGVVYAAYDPELNRRVALKLLRADAFATTRDPAELRVRLLREARALAQLSHPNVMTIYDVGTHEGEVFLAMEFVEGGTLTEWLHAEKRSADAILEIFRQAGEGLAAAHARGIVHRDFKPDNVLLGKDGRTRVSDFGLAHASGSAPPLHDDAPVDSAPLSARATRTGALVGTPAYMAPEQWQGRPSDERTDVFAFSVALYEALHGERPFAGGTAEALSSAIARDEVRPSRGGVPASVRRVLLRGLRANPDERYASMRAMLDDLAPRPLRRPQVALGIALVFAIFAGAFALRKQPSAPVCNAAPREWGDTFDARAESDLQAALARTKNPSASFAFTTVKRTLDDYKTAWIAMRTEACEATRVRGEQSEALLDARMRCLDERRYGAKAYVQSVVTGSSDGLVERATTAAASLPRIDDCGDARALAAPMPLPSDPSKRARLEALGIRATEIESEALEAKDALVALEPVEHEAEAIAYPPLVARLAFDHALFTSRLRDNRRAEIELQRAAVAGEAAHDDAIVMDAWIRLVFVVGYQEHRVDEGDVWARYATAVVARTGNDPRRQALLDANVGIMLLNDETRLDEARERFERSLEATRKADGERSLAYARALGKMSMVLFTAAQSSDALAYEQSAHAAYERAYGPEGIDVAVSIGNEGEELLDTGDADAAIPLLERSAAMQERFGRNDSAVLFVLGHALRVKGKPAEALDVDRRALALYEKNEPEDAYETSYGHEGVALDLLALGRAAEALPHAERAAKLRAITFSPSERGQARFLLARVLDATGDAKRARELAEQARDDQTKTAARYGGRYAAALRETTDWLAAHPKK